VIRVVRIVILLCAVGRAGTLSAQERTGMRDWTIEAAGATIGSVAGFGIGLAIFDDDDCGDDLDCIFEDVAGVLAFSSVGATMGIWALGSAANTDPSFGGALIGSLAGAAAGLGILKVLEEIDSDWSEGAPAVIGFTVTQGVLTAIGSRVGKALRD
jgi:hypothetical protein